MKQGRTIPYIAYLWAGILSCVVPPAQAVTQVLSWNNLGMHCMDDDYSVFAILPPYNTVLGQVVVGTTGMARRVDSSGGLQLTYQAILDGEGSITATSIGKGNFWTYAAAMLGVSLAPDEGLSLPGFTPGASMPGAGNSAKPMNYEATPDWFVAWGVPITPYDDELHLNPYPLMHVASSGGGISNAYTDVVLPVSVEMNCRACHSSGSGPAARPAADWEWNPVPTRDYRFNILRLHDQLRFQEMPAAYTNVLAARNFNTNGLYVSVVQDHHPVLCASCHLSEAIPESGHPDVPPLTEVVHSIHAEVLDPDTGISLGLTGNRSACYRCHPGGETRCLRGAMGRAVSTNGTLAMQCQDCHGTMAMVGAANRTGWLDEPNCQACHTGDAATNSGQMRYTSVYTNGVLRAPVNRRFATTSNAPTANHSLFRFSKGHGGLYCSACHGSTHAEFPSAFRNDNVASLQRQGHVGQVSECSACHATTPVTTTNGPHGMHSLGWVNGHKNPGKTSANCKACHGTNFYGTVLSRSFKNQTQQSVYFWRGRRIGCYECHAGPLETGNPAPAAPTASNVSRTTTVGQAVAFALPCSTALRRIVSQPEYGMVALAGTNATYQPAAGFIGTETFTFCSDSGVRESNLATGTVTVVEGGPCSYALDTNLEFFDELGHVDVVQVTASNGCPWTATSETLWLGILAGMAGAGNGEVRYSVARNTDVASRMGTLLIAGKSVTVVQDGRAADVNGDGLPDSWQMLYFNSPDSTNALPGLDPDHDGASNLQEYLAGTIPTDETSTLRILSFDASSLDPLFHLAFPSLLRRLYQVQRSPDLQTQNWKGFTNAVFGTGAALPFSSPIRTNEPTMYYRVLHVY